MGKDFGVTFLGLWWAEFHAEKEMGAKMVGLPGSAVLSDWPVRGKSAQSGFKIINHIFVIVVPFVSMNT